MATPAKPAAVSPNARPKRAAQQHPLVIRLVKEAMPYLLALLIFGVTAKYALNTTAARYADQLFALALLLMKTNLPPPPAPPSAPDAQDAPK